MSTKILNTVAYFPHIQNTAFLSYKKREGGGEKTKQTNQSKTLISWSPRLIELAQKLWHFKTVSEPQKWPPQLSMFPMTQGASRFSPLQLILKCWGHHFIYQFKQNNVGRRWPNIITSVAKLSHQPFFFHNLNPAFIRLSGHHWFHCRDMRYQGWGGGGGGGVHQHSSILKSLEAPQILISSNTGLSAGARRSTSPRRKEKKNAKE